MSRSSGLKDWGIFSSKREGPPVPAKSKSKRQDYGLHTIVPGPKATSRRVDIVAIHGLNGHYLQTWTDEATGVNWLRDLLPRTVPDARVMSLSYNSMLQFSKSTADVSTFALQLLEGISAERESLEEASLPIIFICHSLGGLVFKQAYILATRDPQYVDLKARFKGVMFFGTPHRGSNLAPWAKTFAGLLEFASFNTSTNTQLARDLEPSSKKLRRISDTFHGLCSRDQHPVISCYETNKMTGLNAPVVDSESAVLGLENEVAIPVEGDHRSMCRFSSPEERRFRPVIAQLGKMVKAALAHSSNRVQALMDSLKTVDYVAHRARNPAAVEGTCRWVLNHPQYKDWLQSPEASFLWISGDPGSGKSVLASFLVDALAEMRRTSNLNFAYFFFKSDNLEQSSAANALQALLHQLLIHQPDLASEAVSRLPGEALDHVSQLWDAIVSLTSLETTRTTICILDAVDECAVDLQKDLLRCISSFLVRRTALKPSADGLAGSDAGTNPPASKLKIIVTSRPDNHIKVAFEKKSRAKDLPPGASAVKSAMIRLRAEDEADNIGNDVTRVIESQIEGLIEDGLPGELMETVQRELIARADRTFLWVSLVLNLLQEKVEAGASKRELDAVLKTRDIYSIYSQLLESKPNHKRARKLLSIILAAARALTLDEISVALAVVPANDILRQRREKIPLEAGTLTLDEVEDDMPRPFENHIKSLCGHFVRIIRNKVYLVHETAREFLLATSGKGCPHPSPPSVHHARATGFGTSIARSPSSQASTLIASAEPFQHSFTLLEARALLLEICVTYLYCLAKGARGSKAAGYTTPLTRPFLRYVASSWAVHFHQVSRKLRPQDAWYFQNLCHPLFPGFHLWVEEYWRPDPPRHPEVVPGRTDEIQDYYVDHFGIELYSAALTSAPHQSGQHQGDEGKDSSEGSDGSDEGSGENVWFSDTEGHSEDGGLPEYSKAMPRQISSPSSSHLYPTQDYDAALQMNHRGQLKLSTLPGSANPTSLGNHHFPLRVDPNGMVTLDYPHIGGIGSNDARGSRRPKE